MAHRPLVPLVVVALVVALVVAACSAAAIETTTDAPAAPSTSTSSSTSTSTSTSTTTTTMAPMVTLRGPVPKPLGMLTAKLFNHLLDRANEPPWMPADLAAHLDGLRMEAGVVRAKGNTAKLANGDRVGVVETPRGSLVFVRPAGPDERWTIAAAMFPGIRPWLGGPGVRNLLVIGSDARVGENQLNLRADSIHILTLLPRLGTGALVGFPRDSWLLGSKLTDLMPGRGPGGMLGIMEDTTGLELDGWVAVGFEGFLDLMRAFGKLEINLPTAMPSGNSWPSYPEGLNILKPSLVLQLARIRKALPYGDFDRTVNQGRIILAALATVKERGLLYLPEWVSIFSEHGFTNMGTRQLVRFAAAAHVAKPRKITNLSVPGSVGWVGSASVVFLGDGAEALYVDMADGRIGNGR